ncbi:hypothetical protein IC580_11140 [Cupriavidus sp. ISTL7]|nr:hypothetical protein IC580_11140 [Cupriavidus sp. ISTL7]
MGPGNWLAYARRFGFLDADTAIIVVNGADYGDVPTFAPLRQDTHPSQPPLSALVEGATRYLPAYLGLDQSSDRRANRRTPTAPPRCATWPN